MPVIRTKLLVVILSSVICSSKFAVPIPQEASAFDDMDHSIKPGDDFYRYANGAWLKRVVIPAGQSSYDNRALLMQGAAERVRNLIQEAAASDTAKGSIRQKVGAYYASFMDQEAI